MECSVNRRPTFSCNRRGMAPRILRRLPKNENVLRAPEAAGNSRSTERKRLSFAYGTRAAEAICQRHESHADDKPAGPEHPNQPINRTLARDGARARRDHERSCGTRVQSVREPY